MKMGCNDLLKAVDLMCAPRLACNMLNGIHCVIGNVIPPVATSPVPGGNMPDCPHAGNMRAALGLHGYMHAH